jgi:hypothetical protein
MTLVLTPCGRGKWHHRRLTLPGAPDLTLTGRRLTIELPGEPARAYWITKVEL